MDNSSPSDATEIIIGATPSAFHVYGRNRTPGSCRSSIATARLPACWLLRVTSLVVIHWLVTALVRLSREIAARVLEIARPPPAAGEESLP